MPSRMPSPPRRLYAERVSTPPRADEPPSGASPRTSRFTRLRAATDRVPTKWFAAIWTALFLAATAAFGGLSPVAAVDEPLEQLSAGETHHSPQLDIAVERAVLIDSLSGSGVSPDQDLGERVLVVLVRVENLWTRPLRSGMSDSFAQAVLVDGDGRPAGGVVREDDQTAPLWLQPNVPALLAYSWAVDPEDYADVETLTVVLQDAELIVGQLLYTGEDWGQYAPAAHVAVPLEDVGAGVGG